MPQRQEEKCAVSTTAVAWVGVNVPPRPRSPLVNALRACTSQAKKMHDMQQKIIETQVATQGPPAPCRLRHARFMETQVADVLLSFSSEKMHDMQQKNIETQVATQGPQPPCRLLKSHFDQIAFR